VAIQRRGKRSRRGFAHAENEKDRNVAGRLRVQRGVTRVCVILSLTKVTLFKMF